MLGPALPRWLRASSTTRSHEGSPCSNSSHDLPMPRRFFLRVLCGRERLNTEVTEILRVLCVGAFEAQRARRSSFWSRRTAALFRQNPKGLLKEGWRSEVMFLKSYRKSYGEGFFVGNITRAGGLGLRHDNLRGFSRLGHRHLKRLRFSHATGFANVPWPATGLKARSPGGARKSHQADQQEHDASHKMPPVMRNDSLHGFVEELQKSPWNIQHPILPSDLPHGKLLRRDTLKFDMTKPPGSLTRRFARWMTLPLDA